MWQNMIFSSISTRSTSSRSGHGVNEPMEPESLHMKHDWWFREGRLMSSRLSWSPLWASHTAPEPHSGGNGPRHGMPLGRLTPEHHRARPVECSAAAHAQHKYQSIGNINQCIWIPFEVQQLYTWQNPDSPAIDSNENALARKFSNATASMRSFGGEPGTVGIARIPSSCRWGTSQ